ncbi:MAG: branched-chain amino acid ABC transporter permease [Syntrophorhabdales bacterium]|jgi:branched-chain amino acid transport system permease protein
MLMLRRTIKWILLGALIAALIAVPHVLDRYTVFLLYLLFLYVGLAQGWNLLAGYAGLISLGVAAFFGIGAYTAAMTIIHLNLHFLLGSLLGGLVAMMFAAIIAVPIFRFRGIYFTIGTLVISEALRIFMISWKFTGSADGLNLPIEKSPSLMWFYYLMLGVAAAATLLVVLILRTKLGMGLRAIGNNEKSAQNMGVNAFRTKLSIFLISAFITGTVGGVHATQMGSIEPYSIFNAMWTLSTANTVIIGGIGTVLGPVLGSIFIIALGEMLADYHTFHLAITGVLLIVIIRFIPAGIWGTLRATRGARLVLGKMR